MEKIHQESQKSGVPQWVTSVLLVATGMKTDKLRRRKAYKMLQKRLWVAGIGQECAKFPTYVYPDKIKALIRSVFPEGVCNYPDPEHEKVVRVTMEDMFRVQAN